MDKYFKKKGMVIADYGYLLNADRGGLADVPFTMWRLEYDSVLVDQVKEWFEKIDKDIKEKIYPERPFVRDSISCSYCRFKEWCWKDMPAPETPVLEPDANIIPPSQEIVESMARVLVEGKAKASELEKELETAENVLKQYFKATGNRAIDVGGIPVTYEIYDKATIDEEYLLKYAKDRWSAFAKPQITLLRKAVDDGIISGTMFEKAMTYEQKDRIKVGKPKKA
jgi:hypothetical protein